MIQVIQNLLEIFELYAAGVSKYGRPKMEISEPLAGRKVATFSVETEIDGQKWSQHWGFDPERLAVHLEQCPELSIEQIVSSQVRTVATAAYELAKNEVPK